MSRSDATTTHDGRETGRRRRTRRVLALCFVPSVVLHVAVLLLIARWWTPDGETSPEQVTVVDLQDEPERLEEESPELPPEPEKEPRAQAKPVPEIEFEALPEPEPEPEAEPPQEVVLDQRKMVEQPDELDETEVPEDVDYLSNINRTVDEQTRAELTNLEEDAIVPEAKQIESSDDTKPGTAAAEVIAQDEDRESQLDRRAPKVTPELREERPEQRQTPTQSLLAMRDLDPRDHKLAVEAHEALADEALDGTLRGSQAHEDTIVKREQQASSQEQDEAYRFRLSHADLDARFGKNIDADKASATKEQSKTRGVWADQRARWQSPLENMVPEVQVGNQTALGSRKDPFARYIAQMHRKIHDAWAWGFLEQLDTRGRTHPLNDYTLWARLEIVLNADGTVDGVKTVHHSGKMVFDAAAREIVFAAGPFPGPPRSIVSKNGKIYVHWAFHRDERACGTFGAQPFILDAQGRGDRPDANAIVRGVAHGAPARRLRRSGTSSAVGPARPPKPRTAPKPEHKRAETVPVGDPSGVANAWLNAFAKGDMSRLAARSGLPFYKGDTVVATNRAVLAEILTSMRTESQGPPKAVKILTAAELRKVFGSVPAGVEEGIGRTYGLTRVGGDYVVLMLEKAFGAWKVIGLAR